jgi:hypothetical protein
MSLEAWAGENLAGDQPMRECQKCDNGETCVLVGRVFILAGCLACNGTGEIPDEYEPLPDGARMKKPTNKHRWRCTRGHNVSSRLVKNPLAVLSSAYCAKCETMMNVIRERQAKQ